MLKIYVASSWKNQEQPIIVSCLRDMGHDVYDFKNPTSRTGFGWSKHVDPNWQNWTLEQMIDGLRHPTAVAAFTSDMDALKTSDICVLVTPCGRDASLEMGYATGAGKKTIVLLREGHTADLMLSMCDHIVTGIDELVDVVKSIDDWDG